MVNGSRLNERPCTCFLPSSAYSINNVNHFIADLGRQNHRHYHLQSYHHHHHHLDTILIISVETSYLRHHHGAESDQSIDRQNRHLCDHQHHRHRHVCVNIHLHLCHHHHDGADSDHSIDMGE